MKRSVLLLSVVTIIMGLVFTVPAFAAKGGGGKGLSFGITASKVKLGEGDASSSFWSNGFHGLTAVNGRVYAAWATGGSYSNGIPERILFVMSTDGGYTWDGDRIISAENALGTSYFAASIAVDQSGTIHVVWDRNDTDAMYSRSTDGHAWSTPVSVNGTTLGSWGVSVAAGDSSGEVHVAWASRDGDIYVSTTIDGISWSTVKVNAISTNNNAPSIGCNNAGEVMITWHGSGGSYFSKSTDSGVTWEVEVLVDPLRDLVSLAADPVDGSKVYAAGNGVCAESADGGTSWSVYPLPEEDVYDVSLAVGPNGDVNAAWRSRQAADVVLSRSLNGCRQFSTPTVLDAWGKYPAVSVDSDGKAHVMWGVSRAGLNPNSRTVNAVYFTREK